MGRVHERKEYRLPWFLLGVELCSSKVEVLIPVLQKVISLGSRVFADLTKFDEVLIQYEWNPYKKRRRDPETETYKKKMTM